MISADAVPTGHRLYDQLQSLAGLDEPDDCVKLLVQQQNLKAKAREAKAAKLLAKGRLPASLPVWHSTRT